MNPRRQWLFFTVPVFLLVIACAESSGLAAEGGGENAAEAPIGTLFRWLNFFLVFGGLGYLIAKRGPAFFRGRAEIIAASITEAAAVRAAAQQRLREAEERLARLSQDVAELRAAAQRESAAEAERIRAVAREEAEKIGRAARAEIEAAEGAAWMELKAIAARAAVQRADVLIRQRITADTRAALFRAFVANLSRSAN